MNTCIDRRFPSYFPIMFHIFSHIYSILVHSQIFHICSHICSHLFSHDIDFPICFPYLFPHRNPSSGFPRQPRPLGHVLLDAAQRLLRRRPMAAERPLDAFTEAEPGGPGGNVMEVSYVSQTKTVNNSIIIVNSG